jgi:hypothetical protein
MNRRLFLASVAAVAAAPFVPKMLSAEPLVPMPRVHIKTTTVPGAFKLGFQVSDELIEDDLYGRMILPFPRIRYGRPPWA